MNHDEKLAQVQEAQGEMILKFFRCGHLPVELREVSERFGDLALHIAVELPKSAERTVALRKLLESKDAAVRAALPAEKA